VVEKDFLLKALLCHNYLPTARRAKEELPPCFSTESFTPDVARELVNISYRKGAFSGYDQVEYKLTRFNSVSRLLSVPQDGSNSRLLSALLLEVCQQSADVEPKSARAFPSTGVKNGDCFASDWCHERGGVDQAGRG
jgi:hypothetical protein